MHDSDVVALTETWLHDAIYDNEFVPPEFEVHCRDRNKRGGGVALLFKKKLKLVRMNDPTNIESLFCKSNCDQHCVIVGVAYRPPGSHLKMLQNLKSYVRNNTRSNTKIVLCGDFNLPAIDWSTYSAGNSDVANGKELIDIAFCFDLNQLVKEHTRIQGSSMSVLDLVFVRSNIPGEIQ